MNYASLVDVYRRLDATTSTNEKIEIVAGTLRDAASDELPSIVTMMRGKSFPD